MAEISQLPEAKFGKAFQAIVPGTSQKKDFTNSSSQSAALGASTTIARFLATQDCFLAFGSNPTAVTDGTNVLLKANVPEYFGVFPGVKVAVIEKSADGTLYITEGL